MSNFEMFLYKMFCVSLYFVLNILCFFIKMFCVPIMTGIA